MPWLIAFDVALSRILDFHVQRYTSNFAFYINSKVCFIVESSDWTPVRPKLLNNQNPENRGSNIKSFELFTIIPNILPKLAKKILNLNLVKVVGRSKVRRAKLTEL